MPCDLALQTDRTGLDAASACKVLNALIRQRQRDVQRARDSSDRLARCRLILCPSRLQPTGYWAS